MKRGILMIVMVGLMGFVLRVAGMTPLMGAPGELRVGSSTTTTAQSIGTRFGYVDVYVDSKGEPLAAYQLEFASETGRVTIAGVEVGEHPAFAKQPPYYDLAAMQQNRVILAAFSLDRDLPKGRTRVARIHVMIEGERPQYAVKLQVAADGNGKAIAGAGISLTEGARP